MAVVAPILLNVGFFWVVDNLIMRQKPLGLVDADAALTMGGWPMSSVQNLNASLISASGTRGVGVVPADGGEPPARGAGPRMWCLPIPEGGAALSTAPYAGPIAAGAPRTPLRARTPAARTACANTAVGVSADVQEASATERSDE